MRGAEAAAKARAKRDETVAQSQTRPRQGRDEHLPPVRKSGIMLVRLQDQEARRKATQLKFHLTSDPVDFVDKVVKAPARHQKVHVVLAALVDTDFSLSARIAAALMGGFYATPQDFLAQDESRRGIMYAVKHRDLRDSFHVAVSASLEVELPTLSPLLKAIAQAPGSCFKLYASERRLCRFFKRTVGGTPRILKRVFALATQAARHKADHEYREFYMSPQSFLLKLNATDRAVCPAWLGSTSSGGRPVSGSI